MIWKLLGGLAGLVIAWAWLTMGGTRDGHR
jgi:hypothetical protein